MKTISILFLYLLSCQISTAQQSQAFYAELLGSAFAYSVNYETRFKAFEDTGLGARIGLFYIKEQEDHYIGIPFHLNYLFGEGRSKFELGAGLTIFPVETLLRSHRIFPSGAIMYRWQAPQNGFLFRVGLAPIFIPDERVAGESDAPPPAIFWFWPGISFGYKF